MCPQCETQQDIIMDWKPNKTVVVCFANEQTVQTNLSLFRQTFVYVQFDI